MNYLIQTIIIIPLLIFSIALTSCESDCEKNCDNGICEYGICDCFSGWKGKNCDTKIGSSGNGNCNSTSYSGTQNCGTSGYIAVTSNTCCPSTHTYHNSATSKCYKTCDAAYSANSSGYISHGTGDGSGGGNGGGGGNSCGWNKLSNLSVQVLWNTNCNSNDAVQVKVTNNYTQKMKFYVCVEKVGGGYSGYGDTNGTESGGTFGVAYTCHGTGNYIIYSEYYDTYIDNGYCSSPGCN